MNVELDRERLALVQADRDIVGGRKRVTRQFALIAEMRERGLDSNEGERLLALLDETLAQWERHREMIVERITYLEGKEGHLGATPGGLSSGKLLVRRS